MIVLGWLIYIINKRVIVTETTVSFLDTFHTIFNHLDVLREHVSYCSLGIIFSTTPSLVLRKMQSRDWPTIILTFVILTTW